MPAPKKAFRKAPAPRKGPSKSRLPDTKIYVLDTNVILHDASCLRQFAENDVVIPITVLEELDNFKKGNESIHFQAREFLRDLDALSGDRLMDGGVKIGPKHGKVSVVLEKEFPKDLAGNFTPMKPDHQILAVAYHLQKRFPERQVTLVTKDVNLRLKAKSVGLPSQDYKNDHVKDLSSLYTGRRIEEGVSDALIDRFYREPFEIDAAEMTFAVPLMPNEHLILRRRRKSALAVFDATAGKLRRVERLSCQGIKSRNAEQAFALDVLMNRNIRLVTVVGKAGTGKTLLALAAALESRKDYRQIFIARPVVALSNKDIGYLPGDIQNKLDPYMQPLYDNLGVIQAQMEKREGKEGKPRKIKDFIEEEKLIVAPLAYIRGRSLVRTYFIVDEAQNLTPHEIKTIITRAGEGTKLVFTGDIFQIDHPYLNTHSNGLSYLIEKMTGQALYGHVTLEKGERSELAELASNLL